MRLLHRIDARRMVLLLIPVLLLAAVLQRESSPVVPSAPVAAPAVLVDRLGHVRDPAPAALPAPAAPKGAQPPAGAPPRLTRATRMRSWALVTRPTTPQQRGQAALAALGDDWRRLGYDVVFRAYEGGTLGTANRVTRRITVYVRRGQSELSLRATIAHELGHALDFEHGTPERRAAYLRIRGIRAGTPWFPCNRCDDLASPAGDFAEVFAARLVGAGDFRSRLAGVPDRRELAKLAPLLRIPERRAVTAGAPAQPQPSPSPSPSAAREPSGPLPAIGPPPPSPRAA